VSDGRWTTWISWPKAALRCRHLDLSGLTLICSDGHIAEAHAILDRCAPHLCNLTDLILPNIKSTCWTASWITKLASLTSLRMNGFNIQSIGSDGLRNLSNLRSLEAHVTQDAIALELAHRTNLRDLRISFGKAGAPSCESLCTMLSGCAMLTRLHFTFAQSFSASMQLIEAISRLEELEDLQINSFNVLHLPENGMSSLSALTKLRDIEVSGMNRLWLRCAIDAMASVYLKACPLFCAGISVNSRASVLSYDRR
jgi:hypothetical protein